MNPEILHDAAQRRFYCAIDGKDCALCYDIKETAPGIMDIFRTFVHPDLRGQRFAEALLRKAIAFARQSGLSIRPSCSYAAVYFRRHREHQPLLASDADLKHGGSCRVA